jgi:hypothetical protein
MQTYFLLPAVVRVALETAYHASDARPFSKHGCMFRSKLRLGSDCMRVANVAPFGMPRPQRASPPTQRQPARQRAAPPTPQPPAHRDAIRCSKCHHKWTVRHDSDIWSADCRKCNAKGYRKGIGKYSCDCGNNFVSKGRLDVRAPCYECRAMVHPAVMRPADKSIQRETTNTHSCELCMHLPGRNKVCPMDF